MALEGDVTLGREMTNADDLRRRTEEFLQRHNAGALSRARALAEFGINVNDVDNEIIAELFLVMDRESGHD